MVERIGSVIVPSGVALYAVLHLGAEQVYGIFGISPQQAEIDRPLLLGRLMGTLILLLSAVPPLPGLVGVYRSSGKVTRGPLRLRKAGGLPAPDGDHRPRPPPAPAGA